MKEKLLTGVAYIHDYFGHRTEGVPKKYCSHEELCQVMALLRKVYETKALDFIILFLKTGKFIKLVKSVSKQIISVFCILTNGQTQNFCLQTKNNKRKIAWVVVFRLLFIYQNWHPRQT
jgi:hypothetical protein